LALEQALHLRAADAERGAELGEAGRAALALVERAIDQPAGTAHLLQRRVARRLLVRTAAQAGAIAGMLGRLGQRKELHVLAQRPPAGAGRAAIDAGGGDGIDESAIGGARARRDGLPALLFAHGRILCTQMMRLI